MRISKKYVSLALVALSVFVTSLPAYAEVAVENASSPNTATDKAVIKVTWQLVQGALDYSVIASSNQADSVRGKAVCGTTECTSYISPLIGGTSYTVTVTPINSQGASMTSMPSPAFRAVSVPTSPTAGTVDASGTSAILNWSLPTSDGGTPITTCKISGGPSVIPAFAGTLTSKRIDNLTPGLTYSMSIFCSNANGDSAPASFTPFTVRTAPSAPVKPTFSKTATTLVAGWVAPAKNGADLTGFKVYLVNSSGADVGTPTDAAATDTSATIQLAGISSGTYSIQVSAINAIGEGPRSVSSNTFAIGAASTPTPTPTPTPSATPSASPTPSATPSSSATPSPTPSAGSGGGSSSSPIQPVTSSPPPVIIAPRPNPTPIVPRPNPSPSQPVVPAPPANVAVRAVPDLAPGSTRLSSVAQVALTNQAKQLLVGTVKQVTVSIATKGTSFAKAKLQAAVVAKALTKAGVTATVKVTGAGAKTVITVVATKKKK
jgi:hypothetical protein